MKKKSCFFMFLYISIKLYSNNILYVNSNYIITEQLSHNAIIRMEPGFEKDFLVLHCLLKQFAPKVIFEIGTCEGYGTLIMSNACPSSSLISLDLPPYSPPFFHNPSRIGYLCNRPYQQVFGDSLTYNYNQHYPIDAFFFDGAHDYQHVKYETEQAIKLNTRLLIYHDTDIPEVLQAIIDTLENTNYKIYRVTDTRISYAILPLL